MVLSLAPRGFSPGTTDFHLSLKTNTFKFHARTRFNEFLRTPWCSVGKQITIFFSITITNATQISKNTTSWLDVILTNVAAFIKDSGIIETGLSDHCLIYPVLNTNLMLSKADIITTQSFQNYDQDAFLRDLSTVPFSVAYTFDEPDDVYWCWDKLYNRVLDEHATVITTKKRRTTGSKFITPDIGKFMRERDGLKKKFNKSRNSAGWKKYRLIRNIIVGMRRKVLQG